MKIFGELFWPQRRTFQVVGGYKHQENHIYHRNLSSVTPFFRQKKKFCTGAGWCMLFFSQKQGDECWIRGNHGNHRDDKNHWNPGCNPGCKARVPQGTGVEIPDFLLNAYKQFLKKRLSHYIFQMSQETCSTQTPRRPCRTWMSNLSHGVALEVERRRVQGVCCSYIVACCATVGYLGWPFVKKKWEVEVRMVALCQPSTHASRTSKQAREHSPE